MVGRDRELAQVLGYLSAPDVRVTLLVGDAGIGKSRLVAEVIAASPERLTMAGGCLPMRHALPLLGVVDALDTSDPAARRALTRAVRSLPASLRPHLAGVMPRTLPEEIEPADDVRRDQVFLACEALLSRAAEDQPVTLVVEDVHWADPDTLDLLTYLAGARHSAALHLLVTCRADESSIPEAVTEWLDSQRRSAGVQEVGLGPLGADDVLRLVAAMAHPDGTDVDRLASQVFARGQGNPFFTEQLVASAADGGGVPHRLARLLSARVRAVSPPAQEAITALAVIGRSIPIEALRVVTLQDEEGSLAAVRELEAASLTVRTARGLGPRHALLAEALLEELPGLPAAYHRRVAAALESLDDPATIPEVAEHLRRAGDEEAELRVAQLAAQRARDLGAYAEAARWYRRVIELHHHHPGQELTLSAAELTRRTLRALDLGGARVEATALAEKAVVDFAQWPDMVERLKVLSQCAHLVSGKDGERGLRMLEDLDTRYDALPPSSDHAHVLSWIAYHYRDRGDNVTALDYLTRALALVRAGAERRGEAHVHARLGLVLRELGDRHGADRHTAAALRLAEETDDNNARLSALVTDSDNRLKYAEYAAAATSAERGLAVTAEMGLDRSHLAHILRANAAEAHLALGQTDEACRLVDELSDRPFRPSDDTLGCVRAHCDVRRGEPAAAAARLRGGRGMVPGDLEAAREQAETLAYALLWNGRPGEAIDVATDVLVNLGGLEGHAMHAGLLLSLGARAAADLTQEGDGDRATAALARLDKLRDTMALDPFADSDTLPRAAADRRQWEAERSRAEGRADPDAWLAAARTWESLAMPHDAAYCWWRAAQALAATDAGKDALRDALHAAHRLADGHLPLRQQVDTLAARERIPVMDATADVDDDPARNKGLTAQELRVLGLLAGGLTNAEIGTALFISPKTASVHVSNLLRKLGVTNRTEAAAWAIHHGLTTHL